MRHRPLLLAVFLGGTSAACSQLFSGDVTDSRDVRAAGWEKATIYLTVRPTFLLYGNLENRYWLSRSNVDHLSKVLAHQCGPFSLPRSLDEYEKNPGKWPHIVRVVPVNSRVRFDQAYSFGFPYGGEPAGRTVRGTLLEAQAPTPVDLTCVAIPDGKSPQWRRDDTWLSK
jgi:hypothetical protein